MAIDDGYQYQCAAEGCELNFSRNVGEPWPFCPIHGSQWMQRVRRQDKLEEKKDEAPNE
jgi:hypothetical protein